MDNAAGPQLLKDWETKYSLEMVLASGVGGKVTVGEIRSSELMVSNSIILVVYCSR